MALFTDNFTGTAGDKLTVRSGWTKYGSGFDADAPEINASNQLRASTAASDVAFLGQTPSSLNHYVQATCLSGFTSTGPSTRAFIAVRAADRNDFWGVSYNSTDGAWELVRVGSGSGRYETYFAAFTSGDVARLEADSTTLRVYINGTLRMTSAGITEGLTNTAAGLLIRGTPAADPVLDNWESGELGGGDTTVPTLTGVITEVSKTANSISISWPAGADDLAVTSYEVSSNGGTSYIDVGNVLAYTFSSLSPSTAYALRVRAKDGASLVSTPPLSTSITTLAADTTNPAFPGGTTLGFTAKTNTSVALTASADATDNIAVTGYEWSSDGGATYPFTSLTRSFTFTSLTELTSYNFRVRGYDGAGLKTAALSLTTSTYRAGATGQDIIDLTGPVDGGQPGIIFNDVVMPGDANKWFSFRLITSPSAGVFSIDALGRFTLTGVASTSFSYQLEVDGVDIGADGNPGTYAVPVTIYDTTIYRPTGDVTTTGWTSTGANLFGVIDEVTADDGDYITSPGLSGTPGPAVLSFTTPLPTGTYTWRVRAQRLGTVGDIRVVLQDGAGASVGASAWQTVTDTFALYELPLSTSAEASRAAIEVRE